MEYLEEQPLKYKVSGPPLQLDTLRDLAIEVADAQSLAHAIGIVHAGIKPAKHHL